MRRGFKSEAERLAADVRQRVGCAEADSAALDAVAESLGVRMLPADALIERSRLAELAEIQPDSFSAATFKLPNGERVVVYNPLHDPGRTRSNQAHELAHIILDHNVRTIERVGDLKFLTCDIQQEEEADWLGGCLLLPRALLLKAAWKGMDAEQIAQRFQTSVPMARFRLNASGVLVQVGRARAATSRDSTRSGP